ncbi:MAG: hypothetical protein MI746_03070 [Pseudomonadales bacterium]|nr:hypothetical protein [Pseudomonadales bacterium]
MIGKWSTYSAALFFLVLIQPSSVRAQLNCSGNEQLALLDFWFGEWRVENEVGEPLGRNTIFRLLNGCVVQERWQGVDGGVGISVFYISPQNGKLQQLWISGQALLPGGTKEKELVDFELGESVQFQGSYPLGEETILDRTTLSRQDDGNILQLIEISRDNGVSWESAFRGIYKRR